MDARRLVLGVKEISEYRQYLNNKKNDKKEMIKNIVYFITT